VVRPFSEIHQLHGVALPFGDRRPVLGGRSIFKVEARGQRLQACANDINSVTALSFVITV